MFVVDISARMELYGSGSNSADFDALLVVGKTAGSGPADDNCFSSPTLFGTILLSSLTSRRGCRLPSAPLLTKKNVPVRTLRGHALDFTLAVFEMHCVLYSFFAFIRNGGGGGGSGGGGSSGGSQATLTRWWIASLVCSFLVSGAVHEAVAFVAMRRTFWPFSTLFLCIGASMSVIWDALFPVVPPRGVPVPSSAARRCSSSSAVTSCGGLGTETPDGAVGKAPNGEDGAPASNGRARLAQQGGGAATPSAGSPKLDVGERADVCRPDEGVCGQEGSKPSHPRGKRGAARPKMGSWRGWTAIVFYVATSVPVTLALDYLVWQWWRHTFLVE